ncbi:MAG: hypothetical protein JO345_05495 [Streptosporangiaceae bacterium]|nr:hypothetical protein [Streptosporangiaceae bacterium]
MAVGTPDHALRGLAATRMPCAAWRGAVVTACCGAVVTGLGMLGEWTSSPGLGHASASGAAGGMPDRDHIAMPDRDHIAGYLIEDPVPAGGSRKT